MIVLISLGWRWVMCLCICVLGSAFLLAKSLTTEDKKGGVDRSSTVIAKEPEGNQIHLISIYLLDYIIHNTIGRSKYALNLTERFKTQMNSIAKLNLSHKKLFYV